MSISREDAQASLIVVRQMQARMHRLAGISGYFLIIWGLVWFFGCLSNQYMPGDRVWLVWAPATTIGWILSTILGIYMGKQTRSGSGTRIAFFWLALAIFAVLWFFIMQPASVKQDFLFVMTVFTFGGTIVGVITRTPAVIWCNISMAALVVVGYYLLPGSFFLWSAIFYGLTMVGIGLVMRLLWR